jgi:methyl-accepting chemotaxis protein
MADSSNATDNEFATDTEESDSATPGAAVSDERAGDDSTEQRDSGDDDSSPLTAVLPRVLRTNLLAKLFAGLVLILLVSGGTAGFFYVDMDSQLNDQVTTQVRETANLQSDIYGTWLEDRQAELQGISDDPRLTTGGSGVQGSFLEGQIEQSSFEALHIVSVEDGEILASSEESATGGSLYDQIDEDQVSESAFVTNQQYQSASGTTVVGIGTPLEDSSGVVMVGEIAAETSGPDVRQTTEDSRTVVVNGNGEAVFGSEGIPEGVVDDSAENTTVTSQGDWVYATVGFGNGLYMVTQTPSSEAFALSDSILQSFLVTLAVTFGVMSLVVGLGGRSIQQSITTLAQRARTMEEGDLSVDLTTTRADEIGTLYDSFDEMRNSLRERIGQAEQALEDAESAREQAESARQQAETARQQAQDVNEQIETAADEYSEVMEAAADGDLTVRMNADVENDAMAAIASDFNEMMEEFESVVDDVKRFAREVTTASESVTTASQDSRTASEQVSEAIQEISEGALEQSDSLQDITDEMNDLSATVQEIAASSDQVAQVAARTAETGRTGREAATDAIDGMELVRAESNQAVEEIEALETQVEQVDELIARISDIADQTSILALNANIEAARASGDTDGEGFSVVAQEVKTLSEDAKQAADEIEDRLSAIREQTGSAAHAVQETSTGIEEHTESVKNAADALDTVASNADETNNGIQDISTATDEQAATTDQVVSMVDDVAQIAQQTTDETTAATATAKEQTDSMADVADSAAELSTQATQLSETLDRFVTDREDDHKRVSPST